MNAAANPVSASGVIESAPSSSDRHDFA